MPNRPTKLITEIFTTRNIYNDVATDRISSAACEVRSHHVRCCYTLLKYHYLADTNSGGQHYVSSCHQWLHKKTISLTQTHSRLQPFTSTLTYLSRLKMMAVSPCLSNKNTWNNFHQSSVSRRACTDSNKLQRTNSVCVENSARTWHGRRSASDGLSVCRHSQADLGSNSTWLDSIRLDTFDVSSPCILAVSS